MSEEKAESTCSELTDGSKPWPDVVRLGDHIVHRLGLEDSVDTLGRWMAHRIAELIEQAEDGDEETKREATDLILRCWERRRGWTEGLASPSTEQCVQVRGPRAWARIRPGGVHLALGITPR
jgi:hypothetical protein